MLLLAIYMYGQKTVSIYELGDSIVNCETNFENLINNWTTNNVTNADEYKLFRYAYLETITDSTRYIYYRNYFSGDKRLSSSTSGGSGERNGKRYHIFYIKPAKASGEFFDTNNMTEKQKEIMSDEFRQKIKDISTRDFNIDKMNLKHYSYEYHKADTVWRKSDRKEITSISYSNNVQNIASPDSISANYIDINVLGKKKFEQLDVPETRSLILEGLIIGRTLFQLGFNRQVHLGDKVYEVRFEYLGKPYTNYVICSSQTKKVVLDYFFKNINVEEPKYLIRMGKGI